MNQGFYLYLLGGSILYVIYVFFTLLRMKSFKNYSVAS